VTADPIAAAVQTVQGSRKAHPLGAAWDSEEGRANILSFNPDGTDEKVYTTGIRNPAGITIQPATIAFRAIAMGMRNAAVRKLAVPDLTTTVLTLTITGLAADSSLARGTKSPFAAANCSGGGDVCWCSVRLDNPKALRLHGSRFFRRTVVTLRLRVADIVAVALRKKRRKGIEVVS
jgi:hypothetical protein